MTSINMNRILRNNRSLLLAYDQGLENGPKDFDLRTVDPKYVFDIALENMYDGIIVHSGVAEKYYGGYFKEIPLVIKLNGNTSLLKAASYSKQLCTVERAIKLGASAVGYTVYTGSPMEPQTLSEFSKVVDTAHDYGMPVVCWIGPRGAVQNKNAEKELLAYSARIGLELGADFLNMKYNNDPESFKWIVKCAGRTKVLTAVGETLPEAEFLKKSSEIMSTGASGMSVGRNVWQHSKPFAISAALKKIIHENKNADEAIRTYQEGKK